MIYREEIHFLTYSIKISTEQSPGSRGGAGRRGRGPEGHAVSARDDIALLDGGTCGYTLVLGAGLQVGTWHSACVAGACLTRPG